MAKPKGGHSNNTQGQWWEPLSLPIIFDLLAALNDSYRGQELGADGRVMSLAHAQGL